GGAGFGREPLEHRSDHKTHEQVDAGPQRAGHHVEEIQQPVAAVLDRENHHYQSEYRSDDIPGADRRGRAGRNADDLIAHGEAPRKISLIRRRQARTVGAAAARVNRGPLRSLHKSPAFVRRSAMGAIDRPKKRSGRHAVRLRRDGISAGIQTQETADFVTTLNVPRNFVRRFAVGVTRQNLNRLGASMKLKQYLGPEDIQAGPERAMENP